MLNQNKSIKMSLAALTVFGATVADISKSDAAGNCVQQSYHGKFVLGENAGQTAIKGTAPSFRAESLRIVRLPNGSMVTATETASNQIEKLLPGGLGTENWPRTCSEVVTKQQLQEKIDCGARAGIVGKIETSFSDDSYRNMDSLGNRQWVRMPDNKLYEVGDTKAYDGKTLKAVRVCLNEVSPELEAAVKKIDAAAAEPSTPSVASRIYHSVFGQ